jgi:hypothetical protein
MIEYTSDTTATIRTKNVTFFLDSGESGIKEHQSLLNDFKDENKLNAFIALIEANPDTGYAEYLSQRKD